MKRLFAAVFLAVLTPHAHAYLDPGTGSMILQGIIAAVAVVGLTLKNYWYKVRAFFGKETPTSLLESEDEPSKPGES